MIPILIKSSCRHIEKCIYGQLECGDRAMCLPNGSGHDGTCQCESLFGFHGLACRKLSATSFLLVALSIGIIIHSFHAFNVSVMDLYDWLLSEYVE